MKKKLRRKKVERMVAALVGSAPALTEDQADVLSRLLPAARNQGVSTSSR